MLFVPGCNPRYLHKARALRVDSVILDLGDPILVDAEQREVTRTANGARVTVYNHLPVGNVACTMIYGYTTHRNLSAFASFFVMASVGLLIAILVNAIFVQDMGFSLLISCGVVLVFSGVTAYETQMIKNMYIAGEGDEDSKRKAIFGAFALYGSFITLFVHILNILGALRNN